MLETETGMCLQVKGCQPGTSGKTPEAERGKEGVSLGVSRKTQPLNFRPLAPRTGAEHFSVVLSHRNCAHRSWQPRKGAQHKAFSVLKPGELRASRDGQSNWHLKYLPKFLNSSQSTGAGCGLEWKLLPGHDWYFFYVTVPTLPAALASAS